MHPGPSRPSTGITLVFISSRRPSQKGRRPPVSFNNRFNFWMKKERAFAIELITPTDTLRGGNFRRLRRRAPDKARRAPSVEGRQYYYAYVRRTTMLVKSLKLTAICTLCLVVPLLAHHSHGNYDTTKWTTMEGTVTE